jgi:hypothetical protein
MLPYLPINLQEDGLLHTTCGTPNYVAPKVKRIFCSHVTILLDVQVINTKGMMEPRLDLGHVE